MNRLLMIWAGLMLMLFSGLVLLVAWIQRVYGMGVDFVSLLIVGVVKIKVALVGIYYPMAMLRYFERALERRDDIELVTAGPYTGTYIPWSGGMTVLPKYAKPPTHVLPPDFIRNGKIPANILNANEKFQDVDLWLS
jgi:hypothetical protein